MLAFLFSTTLVHAQGTGSGAVTGIMAFLVILIIAGVVFVSDSLLQIEAKQRGLDGDGKNYSIFPGMSELFGSKVPRYVKNDPIVHLNRGFDISLEGKAPETWLDVEAAKTFSVNPKDVIGLAPIPKVVVQVGDEVKAGDELFFDKTMPDVKFVAPVSGEIIEVKRGEKRSIEDVIILADKDQKFKDFGSFDYDSADRDAIVQRLLSAGLWTLIRQRPFNTIPSVEEMPRDIFISTFDSAPLAPNLSFVVQGNEAAFQHGIDLLSKLTEGKVYLGLDANRDAAPSKAFTDASHAEKVWFKGPHPAGNVGIQIHHIKPVNKGEVVWTLNVQDVVTLGVFASENVYRPERVIVAAGAELKNKGYIKTTAGANLSSVFEGNLEHDHVRFISGDVLTGKKISKDGFLSFSEDQVTVVEEGDDYELFGWLLALSPRPSAGNTFPKFKDFDYHVTTNTHGEGRAFVVTGQYEKVLPMNIFAQHIFKSIIVNDFERMEGLGIYELVEEDVALCEFACTSKQPLQQILREGLDVLREQG